MNLFWLVAMRARLEVRERHRMMRPAISLSGV
jgi:hypothetical protein